MRFEQADQAGVLGTKAGEFVVVVSHCALYPDHRPASVRRRNNAARLA